MRTKKCGGKCGVTKDINGFYKDSSRKDGFEYKCKSCKNKLNQDSYKKNKIHRGKQTKQWYQNNRDRLSENDHNCLYELYQPQLEPYGVKCRRSPQDTNILEVKCMYCDKWYQPTQSSVKHKIGCIKGNYKGELNLYCSDGCKVACPTYRQRVYPKGFKKDTSREVQPSLRKLVLERDNWTCQMCESTEDGLHCHHMEGVEINPVESADIDMCITLCKKCHNTLHKRNDCDMRRKKCN